jgi:hypothetical protein
MPMQEAVDVQVDAPSLLHIHSSSSSNESIQVLTHTHMPLAPRYDRCRPVPLVHGTNIRTSRNKHLTHFHATKVSCSMQRGTANFINAVHIDTKSNQRITQQ